MNQYTVIGIYPEDKQTTADFVHAEDGAEALRMVARERLGERDAAGDYENQGIFDLICAVQHGNEDEIPAATLGRFTWAGDGAVEARDYIEPGWDLENNHN